LEPETPDDIRVPSAERCSPQEANPPGYLAQQHDIYGSKFKGLSFEDCFFVFIKRPLRSKTGFPEMVILIFLV